MKNITYGHLRLILSEFRSQKFKVICVCVLLAMYFAVKALTLCLLIAITTSKIHGGIKLLIFLAGVWLGWAISGRLRQYLPEMAGRSLQLLLLALCGYGWGLILFQIGLPSLIICYWTILGLHFLIWQFANYLADHFNTRKANSPRNSEHIYDMVWLTIGSQIAFLIHTGII